MDRKEKYWGLLRFSINRKKKKPSVDGGVLVLIAAHILSTGMYPLSKPKLENHQYDDH